MTARLPGLDAARGVALLAMFVFHGVWDLGHFGYIDTAIPYSPQVKAFGHAIAVSFLAIAGFALALAHGGAPRWPAFARRLALVAGAAALVSAATYVLFPDAFVFFGILHCIAAASLLAALVLRAPWPVAAAAGAAMLAAPMALASPTFDAPALWWVGLSTFTPLTNDYRPLLPWAGALFLGLAYGQARQSHPLPARGAGPVFAPLRWLGRHSLALYLVHQPVFFALFSVAAALSPAGPDAQGFLAACETHCAVGGGAPAFCQQACHCTVEEAAKPGALPAGDGREARITEIGRACAAKAAAAR